MKLPALNDLLHYKNAAVLKLYNQNYPNNHLTAEQAFEETLKYLWLSQKHTMELKRNLKNKHFPSQCFMLRYMREIDEMWHEFILFTKDYTDFCEKYFGDYMHHLPNIFDNMPRPREVVEVEAKKLILYVYDNLGENTVRVWFSTYLDKAV